MAHYLRAIAVGAVLGVVAAAVAAVIVSEKFDAQLISYWPIPFQELPDHRPGGRVKYARHKEDS